MPSRSPDQAAGAAPGSLTGRVAALRATLVECDGALQALDDQGRLDLLRELELLTRTIGSVGARVQVGFHTSQVAAQIEAGVAPSRAGRAVPDDLAQARMTSPYWGSRDLACAKALCAELPHTLAALTDGTITTYQARVITEATTTLEPGDRAEVDARLATRLPGASSKEIQAAARALVYEVDPAGFVKRARKAAEDRGLSLRPCPDAMALLSARLPAPQAIAVYQALRSAAEAKQAAGDPRTLDQLTVDELYERVTGRAIVDGIDVEVGLVITDLALFAGASTAAELTGYGPVPAELARELLRPQAEEGHDEAVQDQAHHDEVAQDKTHHDEVAQDETRHDGVAQDKEGHDEAPQDEAPSTSHEEITARARADAAANAGGFAGGRVPEGHCPDDGRCTDFSCSLVHGAPASPRSAGSPGSPGSPRSMAAPDPEPSSGPVASTEAQESCADRPLTAGDDTTVVGRAAQVWLRRLFADPVTGVLTGRDPRRRLFTGALRAFLVARDRTCRNSWCGAPVRHIDHLIRHRDEGPTDADNGQGLCARCNLARERPRHRSPGPADYRGPPPVLDAVPDQPEQRWAARPAEQQ